MSSPTTLPTNARRLRTVAVLSGALALCVMLSWQTRTNLLAWLMEGVLDGRGLGPADVEVISLGPSHAALALRGSALGTIERIEVDYGLGPRSGLQLQRLRIAGARLQLAWRDGQLFPALVAGGGSSSVPALEIELLDSRVNLRTGASVIVAEVAGNASTGADAAAQLRFALHAPQGQLHGSVDAHTMADHALQGVLTLDGGDLAIGTLKASGLAGQLQMRTGAQGLPQLDGRFTVEQLAGAEHPWGAGVITLARQSNEALMLALQFTPLQLTLRTHKPVATGAETFALDAKLDARFLAALLPAVSVDSGSIEVNATGDLPPAPASLANFIEHGHLQANLQATASALELPGIARVANIGAALACQLGDGAFSCASSQGIHLTGMTLAARLAADDSVLAGVSTLSLSAHEGASLFEFTARESGGEIALNSEVFLQTPQLTLHAPIAAHLRLDDAPSPATTPARAGRFDLRGKLALERPPGQAWLASEFAFAGHYSADLTTHTLVSAQIDDGKLTLPKQGWAANAMHGSYSVAATDTFKFIIGELRNTREPAVIAPLKAELDARISTAEARFNATLQDASKQLDVTVSSHHQRRSGKGEATLTMHPIALLSAEQLRALSPAFGAGLVAASGEISAQAGAQWGAGAPHSALSFELKDINLASATFKVARLNTHLELDSLTPLHSANDQTLSAAFELPVLKNVPVELRFKVADHHLRLEHARAEVFGGAFAVSHGDIDIASGATRIDLQVDDIDLASAFLVLNLEQLKGTGRLSGRLPLRFEGGHIAVEQGQLRTSGPGVVQIGAKSLTDQLQSYGKDVELAFHALSDFHYQSLGISADKTLLGSGKALFHLAGNNPAVMNGQAFIFNISLETDFDYLAKLLLQLSGATNSALGWGAGEMIKQ